MLLSDKSDLLLRKMVELIELPDSAYEKAKDRYNDIGEWLGRDESLCKENDPHIYPQGSFRLGTAIRPLHEKEEYDLDLACNLRKGLSKKTHSQKELKELVGNEIKTYRTARRIETPPKEKHRCWRLEYQDSLSFHMDIVPCIPFDEFQQGILLSEMLNKREDQTIAKIASRLAVSITDDRHEYFDSICDNWNISNPEGYAKWFEYRMKQNRQMIVEKAQVSDLPLYPKKTILQRSVQLLKRHRDQMFKNDSDVKPISVIITTLASRAYQGESNILQALDNILTKMGQFVNQSIPRIPNPVNPNEDFADRWSMPQYSHLHLEENFWNWLRQAKNDFYLLTSSNDRDFIFEQAQQKISVQIPATDLSDVFGSTPSEVTPVAPKKHEISNPAKPWKESIE